MDGSVVNVRWSNEFMSRLDEIKRELADKLTEALERAEAAEAQVAALQTALEEEGRRNAVFTACLHKAQNLYLEAHPDYPGWPDGAVNITWVLEVFDKERAEVKRLRTALQAANEDAERLFFAAISNSYCCQPHAKYEVRRTTKDDHAADCPITLHRARVGGAA